MARMNWAKADRAQKWRESVHNAWSGVLPPSVPGATDKQIGYIQALLVGAGCRPLNDDELARLTVASASRLISELID